MRNNVSRNGMTQCKDISEKLITVSCSFFLWFAVHINYKFPIDPDKEELRWQFLKPRIDSKCRAQRRLQREAQARLDSSPRGAGTPVRTPRARMPRVDPREKDQLLYGYSRTTDLGLTSPRPQLAGDDCQETGVDVGENHSIGASSGLDQLQANEAIVEVAGIPVTIGEMKGWQKQTFSMSV